MSTAEIATALFAAPHLTEETLAALYEYRRGKRATGAPVDLENEVFHAAEKCEEIADELRDYLTRAAKEAADALAGLDDVGSRLDRTWFVLEPRQNAETIAARMRVARYAFRDALKLWVALADRVVATPEETAAKAAEVAQVAAAKRSAAIATWMKLSHESLAAEAYRLGVEPGSMHKKDIAGALVNAGHLS